MILSISKAFGCWLWHQYWSCAGWPTLCCSAGGVGYWGFECADPLRFRIIPEFHLDSLKKVFIIGFCSAKSLIELTCQILKTSSSLQRLVLDTTGGYDNTGIYENMDRKSVMEALRGVEVIKGYVKGKVSSTIKFEILEPCDRCHIPKLQMSPCYVVLQASGVEDFLFFDLALI